MWRRVIWCLFPDISRQPGGLIFDNRNVREERCWYLTWHQGAEAFLKNWQSLSYSRNFSLLWATVLHFRIQGGRSLDPVMSKTNPGRTIPITNPTVRCYPYGWCSAMKSFFQFWSTVIFPRFLQSLQNFFLSHLFQISALNFVSYSMLYTRRIPNWRIVVKETNFNSMSRTISVSMWQYAESPNLRACQWQKRSYSSPNPEWLCCPSSYQHIYKEFNTLQLPAQPDWLWCLRVTNIQNGCCPSSYHHIYTEFNTLQLPTQPDWLWCHRVTNIQNGCCPSNYHHIYTEFNTHPFTNTFKLALMPSSYLNPHWLCCPSSFHHIYSSSVTHTPTHPDWHQAIQLPVRPS